MLTCFTFIVNIGRIQYWFSFHILLLKNTSRLLNYLQKTEHLYLTLHRGWQKNLLFKNWETNSFREGVPVTQSPIWLHPWNMLGIFLTKIAFYQEWCQMLLAESLKMILLKKKMLIHLRLIQRDCWSDHFKRNVNEYQKIYNLASSIYNI